MLTITRVNEIFKAKNPSGYVQADHMGKQGRWNVVYRNGSKMYTYKAKTLFGLLVKLELVPERDIDLDAARIAQEFRNNNDDITGYAASLDTVRWLLSDFVPSGHSVMSKEIGLNEFNHRIDTYTIESDPWAS